MGKIMLAFPQIKTGLIQLLMDGQSAMGGFSMTLWEIAIALLMFIGGIWRSFAD